MSSEKVGGKTKRGGKRAGSGRKKGTPNKFTTTVKDAVKAAFDELQGDKHANLIAWAKANPTDFYKLSGKLIPAAVEATVSGSIIVRAAPTDEGL